jgi:ribosome-associated toxin RatA of RatAB toxin-antitoxin module
VTRSALVPYSADQMYALVQDVESYPEFLPWCTSTTVHSRNATELDATLELSRGSIQKSFRTRNALRPGRSMTMELVDGPFNHLEGVWRFEQLGSEGSKVQLNLDFEFKSRITDSLFGPYFEETCSSLVDSFTKQASKVYG